MSTSENISKIIPDIKVAFILSPKFTLFAFAGMIDSLRHAADDADYSRQIYCNWKVIAPKIWPITASCGLEVMPNEVFPDPKEFDYIVMVGGLIKDVLSQPQETYEYLKLAHEQNVTLVGLCVGSFALAKAGLMDFKKCAVHFEHRVELRSLFPKTEPIIDRNCVEDGNIITCPGGTSSLDLAYNLIERHCGRARATKAMISLIADKDRAQHHIGYRPFGYLSVCGSWKVEKAYEYMEKNITNPCSIVKLADKLESSERDLSRAFLKHAGENPQSVWRKMRLYHGRWLLLNSHQTITQIAMETGFADSSHFNRWFKTINGVSPNEFRKQHKGVHRREKIRFINVN